MPIDKKKVIMIAVVVVVVVVVAVALILLVKQSPSVPGPAAGPAGGKPAAPAGPVTRETAPENVTVPNQGDKNAPQNVAVPSSVSPGSASGSTSIRKFSIKIENNEFTPNTVIVKLGDTVDLSFTAVDRDYDFTQPDYGFKASVLKGSSQRIQFGATAAGKFTFYCSSCGGPSKGPVGYVIIAP